MSKKYVYFFGNQKAEGNATQKNLLGGKGANLAEMTNLGIPVPPGFTISTEVCTHFYEHGNTYPIELKEQINEKISELEKTTGKIFGDDKNPLLVSVRSGGAVSMPGMMDTVLNLGLNDNSIKGLIEQTGNERFAYDSYRRFIQMFSNVVYNMDHHKFENILEAQKKAANVTDDTELSADDLKIIVEEYKKIFKSEKSMEFPQEPQKQLEESINAVFASWMNPRANTYRNLNNISHSLGTAVNVQSMVFGNMGDDCGTGVGFTRNPATGENIFFGEFLMNAQGEDVVAGIRTPLTIDKLENILPHAYKELLDIAQTLEKHYKDMQDIEFTIEKEKLYLLQTRSGKRTSFAAFRVAYDMVKEELIDEKRALMLIDPNSLPSLLAKIFDAEEKQKALENGAYIGKGLAAGPGAASGKIVLSAEKAVELKKNNESVILVRHETSPEDIAGMHSAEGILTSKGGMTSHAAVVARGMNKPCIVGCSDLEVNYEDRTITCRQNDGNSVTLKENDWLSIDGFTGEILGKKINTISSEIEQVFVDKNKTIESSRLAQEYKHIMEWTDKFARLKVRANSDTPYDSAVARSYGAQGIGLCRTEHMFFDSGRISAMREMILSSDKEGRKNALNKLLPFQKQDFIDIFKEMKGLPVTIRLLDPPLHEFLPHDKDALKELADTLGKTEKEIKNRMDEIAELNPMLGHRGCRLGISYPEITEMQTRAIIEAACEAKKEGIEVLPEIMVPLVGNYKELANQEKVIRETADNIMKEQNMQIEYLLGTMIEVPRAAITADEIARHAEFFSFGTNDLTQMGAGFSRDDSGNFLPEYIAKGIYENDPFAVLDQNGIGKLMEIAVEKGQKTRENIKLGICGEHGGEPLSVKFCHKLGLNYVSCSPYRVPVARLAAAQAAISETSKS
ncbi:MAG: pyruvate, phosphate dikinase [Spirochaetia bacterium]|nr:pyruvate, phosphate dikinase [Spirochaetia bacterium]